MIIQETSLPGAFLINLDMKEDDRGFFARSFCKKELGELGLPCDIVQTNISYNHKKGTLRGLHYQEPPFAETKIISCKRGAIYDVIVDIRKNSTTCGQWLGVELSEKNYQALYVPEGFAHGFQTLCKDTEVFYLMGNYYHPQAAKGIRWDDAYLNIIWPNKKMVMSEKDKTLPAFTL